jgi:stress response protein YsnF
MMLTTEQLGNVIGRDAFGSDGERIGRTDQIFLDDQTGQPEFAALHTGLFGMKTTLVPLAQATFTGDVLRLPYAKEQIKSAPNVDPDAGHLDQAQEQVLYEYYGLPYSESRSDTGLPAEGTTPSAQGTMRRGPQGNDLSGPETDEAMTRSEEQMRVGTTSRESGRARLRKYIVTEQVQQTVPVRRERAVVEREPITSENIDLATSGPELSEEEHEVILHQETPVVEKRVEPVERVRLSTQTDVSEETVSDEVRKERIETEGDVR